MIPIASSIVRHELRLLRRNPLMWFRFLLFYAVFCAALITDVLRERVDRLTITASGLVILAAVGIATALAAESFVQEKERRTMEALLLIPTSARSVASAKAVFIIIAALVGAVIALATGPVVVLSSGADHLYPYFLNRTLLVTGLIACPPGAILVTALGTLVSSRSRSFQSTTTVTPLIGVCGLVTVLTVAYIASSSEGITTVGVSVSWWAIALVAFAGALSTMRPEAMIRTRGR